MAQFYRFQARTLKGEEIDFSQFSGKVVLVVNTASKCGLTPQYTGLNELYRKYAADGLVILGFPCNQFARQEPGDAAAIGQTCFINYGVDFLMFEKIEVNGEQAHPLFQWLTAQLPGWFGRRIKWNFTKFLIGRDGTPLHRFAPVMKPQAMEKAVRAALGLSD